MVKSIENNMMFFDINYGEYATVSGSSLNTASSFFAFDNRADEGNATWPTISGNIVYNFGDTSTFFYIDSFFVNNHNWKDGMIEANTGSAWFTLTTFSNLTTSAYYYKHSSTIPAYQVRFSFSDLQNSETASYAGEVIATRERFRLASNPSKYKPMLTPNYREKKLYTGLTIANKLDNRENVFTAELGWNFLFSEYQTTTNSDLQNMTELARQNTSFLFWPNGDSDFLNMRTWRKDDLYKCKILDAVSYEFPSPAIAHAIIADYTFIEAK